MKFVYCQFIVFFFLVVPSALAQNDSSDFEQLNNTLIFEGTPSEALHHSDTTQTLVFNLISHEDNKSALMESANTVQQIIKGLSRGKVTPTVVLTYSEGQGIGFSSIAAGKTYNDGDNKDGVYDLGQLTKEDYANFLIHYVEVLKKFK